MWTAGSLRIRHVFFREINRKEGGGTNSGWKCENLSAISSVLIWLPWHSFYDVHAVVLTTAFIYWVISDHQHGPTLPDGCIKHAWVMKIAHNLRCRGNNFQASSLNRQSSEGSHLINRLDQNNLHQSLSSEEKENGLLINVVHVP